MLSFIPPDGHFDLLRYEAVQVPSKGAGATAAGRPFALPLAFKPELKLDEAGGTSIGSRIHHGASLTCSMSVKANSPSP